MPVVDMQVQPQTGKRTVYGIEVCVGARSLNEFALHESEAKWVHECLVANGDEPLDPDEDGIIFKRRPLSNQSQKYAAKLVAIRAKAAAKAQS